jgi:hypothetical protein
VLACHIFIPQQTEFWSTNLLATSLLGIGAIAPWLPTASPLTIESVVQKEANEDLVETYVSWVP